MAQILFSNIYPEGKPLSNIVVDSKEVKYVKTGYKILYDTLKEYKYGTPTITVSYPNVIPRTGGSSIPIVTYLQKRTPVGHSGRNYTAEILEGEVETFTASVYNDYNSGAVLDTETGIVYRDTLGTTSKSGEWTVMSVDISCTINGVSATKRASVKMESNKSTTIYGTTTYYNVVPGEIVNCTVPAKGGNAKVTAAKGKLEYLTTPTYKEYETGDIEIIKLGVSGEIEITPNITSHSTYVKSKGTEESEITTVYLETVIWKSRDKDEDKDSSGVIWILQEANTIEYLERSGPYLEGGNTTYYEVQPGIILQSSTADIPASGGSIEFRATEGYLDWYRDAKYEYYLLWDIYTSEASGNERKEYLPELYIPEERGYNKVYPDENIKVITGESLGTNVVKRINLGYVTFTWEGINSIKTVSSNTVYQQANVREGVYGGNTTYGNISVETLNKSTIVLASGTDNEVSVCADIGSQRYTVSDKYYLYTSESREVILEGYSNVENIYPDPPCIKVAKVASKENNVSDMTVVDSATVVWESLDGNPNKNIIGNLTIYQEANIRTDHFSLGKITVSYPNGSHQGGIVNPDVSVEYINNPSYTSNTPVGSVLIDTITPDRIECTIISGTGGTVQGGAINWSENTSTLSREMFVAVTVYYEGLSKTSDTIRVILHAKPVTTYKGRKAKIINNTSCTLTIQFTNSETFTLDIPAMQTVYKDLIMGQDVEGSTIDAKVIQSGNCVIDSSNHSYWCSTDYLSEVADVWTINSIS